IYKSFFQVLLGSFPPINGVVPPFLLPIHKKVLLFLTVPLLLGALSFPVVFFQNNPFLQQVAAASPYQKLSSLKCLGSISSEMVGPGTTAGRQKYYIGYQYVNYPLDFVAIDPNNNYVATAYASPVSTEYAAAAMAVGADNNVYIGTKSTVNSHILKFN